MKYCNKCASTKSVTEFGKNKSATDGLSTYCKPCKNMMINQSRRTQKGVITRMYTSQRHASTKRKHPQPDYSKEELTNWLYENGFLGLYNDWVESGHDRWTKPSCDRLDDMKGYTLSNIQLCTWQENAAAGHACRVKGEGAHKSQCKAVTRISSCGERKYYATIQQAADDNDTSRCNIGLCCNGHRDSAGKYRWQFTKQT